jgi:hypothetical protein
VADGVEGDAGDRGDDGRAADVGIAGERGAVEEDQRQRGEDRGERRRAAW